MLKFLDTTMESLQMVARDAEGKALLAKVAAKVKNGELDADDLKKLGDDIAACKTRG